MLNTEIRNIKDKFLEEINRTKREVDELLAHEKAVGKNSNQKILELENKIQSYEVLVNNLTSEKSMKERRESEEYQRSIIQL